MALQTVTYAPRAFELLRGFFCIYKPANLSIHYVRKIIIGNLCRDLNEMEVRPPTDFVKIVGSLASGKELTITTVPNLADHPLVVGQRYQAKDIKLTWVHDIGRYPSGVMVMGVHASHRKLLKLRHSNQLRSYELRGEFGKASDTLTPDSKIVEQATYGHITIAKMERLLSSIQATHQVQAFKYSGVRMDSQEAYELAAAGTVRPADKSPMLIYNIRCTEFDLPFFTLEVSCLNENASYLLQLVHDIGLRLRSCALCHRVRQVRYGQFGLDHALLRKHWNLEHILNNINHCRHLVTWEQLEPSSPHLVDVDASFSSPARTFGGTRDLARPYDRAVRTTECGVLE
uniref:Putative pseudouridine synthase n=1 Tax=Ixodes ricinus TaxID=34613 RepID=A0A6B0V8Q5_IXORI